MQRIVGRTDRKKFVLKPASSNSPLIKNKAFATAVYDIDVRSPDLRARTPDKYNRPRVLDSEKRSYVEFLTTSSGSAYIEETPEKKGQPPREGEVRFEQMESVSELRKTNPGLFRNPKRDHFEFTVTEDDIKNRIGKKRGRSQNSLIGCSAEAIFEAYHVIIEEKSRAAVSRFHHAHRHGFSLGGAQSKENLDPGTAGSNYTTLFTIESPIRQLLLESNAKNVKVKGTVIYHPHVPLPIEIIYNISWGNGRTAKANIYPLEHRRPTLDEYVVAKALFSATRTPPADSKNSFFSAPTPTATNVEPFRQPSFEAD